MNLASYIPQRSTGDREFDEILHDLREVEKKMGELLFERGVTPLNIEDPKFLELKVERLKIVEKAEQREEFLINQDVIEAVKERWEKLQEKLNKNLITSQEYAKRRRAYDNICIELHAINEGIIP